MRKFLAVIMIWAGLSACSDDKDVLVSIPNDVTMNELELGRFTHQIPDGGFTSKAAHTNGVKFNTVKNPDGTYSGFAYSTVTTVLSPGWLLRKLWIPISTVSIPVSRMPMKFMPSLV